MNDSIGSLSGTGKLMYAYKRSSQYVDRTSTAELRGGAQMCAVSIRGNIAYLVGI